MKAALYLVAVIAALAFAEETTSNNASFYAMTSEIKELARNAVVGAGNIAKVMQQAVAGDLDLKMVMTQDGSPKGKCYCSCNLNSQPVFMEIEESKMPGFYVG